MTKNSNLTPEDDGSYWVELSALGRRDVNGLRKEPLSDDGCRALIERARSGGLRGEIGHPVIRSRDGNTSWYARARLILDTEVGFTITDLDFTCTDGIQHIRGRMRPAGPRKEVVLTRIARNAPLYFGLRAITETPHPGSDAAVRIIEVIAWDLIDNDPYPPEPTRTTEHPGESLPDHPPVPDNAPYIGDVVQESTTVPPPETLTGDTPTTAALSSS